jgi:hypothetical protein
MRVAVLAGLLSCTTASVALAVSITMSPPPKAPPPKIEIAPKAVAPSPASEVPPPPKVLPDSQAVTAPVPKVPPNDEAATAPQAAPKAPPSSQAKADCPCNCPAQNKTERSAPAQSRAREPQVPYHYAQAAPFHQVEYQPQPYGAPSYSPSNTEQGLHIDSGGWSGGVGYGAEGGGGGGYGQLYYPTEAGNGPTYNSYNQSFQFNPSQPGPFQPRLMGGFAPPGSR